MNIYLVIVLAALIGGWLLNLITGILNLKALTTELPDEFEGEYEADKYARSQEYTRAKNSFGQISDTVQMVLLVGFILLGGYNWVDSLVRSMALPELVTGLLFFGSLFLLSQLVSLPFGIYRNFVLEERFGFNRTSPGTFVLDLLKGWFLSIVLIGALLAGIIAFFSFTGPLGWLWAWGVVSLVMIAMPTIFVTVIAPMFNKFTPLDEGELKEAISGYAKKVSFTLSGIFVVDGSRRSSHSNAYFTGLGRVKRVVLYDTLVEKHTDDELVAVLAHEVGHYRLKHVAKGIALSVIQSGVMLYLMSLFIGNQGLFDAFRMEQLSVHAAFMFFGLLYAPVSMLLQPFMMAMSRKHEYAADAWAVKTTGGDATAMIAGLKRMSVENLSNLTPHPLDVVLNFSHPPVLQRIRVLRKL
jgi:STE24 endopeptidase